MSKKIPILLVMLFLGIILAMATHVIILKNDIVDIAAKHNAKLYIDALATFRTLYSAEVVQAVKDHGIIVTHDYSNKQKSIPLPATFSMLLGKTIGEISSGAISKFYSPYPFPWRDKTGGVNG